MFRKIVTELAYSPALAGNLGLYIKQLRDESSKRQIGLVFMLLAVITQLIALGAPPESANANDPSMFVDTRISSVEQYLEYYDQNANNIRDLLTSLSIKRSDIESMQSATIPDTTDAISWSLMNGRENDNIQFTFQTSNNKPDAAYYRPVTQSIIGLPAYIGTSEEMKGWFAITEKGAALITEKTPPLACDASLEQQETPLIVTSGMNTHDCTTTIARSLSAKVISSRGEVPDLLRASDRIAYTIALTNTGETTLTVVPAVNLEDLLEYSRILDHGGGEYNYDTKNIAWASTPLAGGETIQRTFIIQLLPTIPATASGQYIKTSYDCRATVSFGDIMNTPVHCPFPKYVERVTTNLPHLSRFFIVAITLFLLSTVIFFYLRARQQLAELYIIRHNHLGNL